MPLQLLAVVLLLLLPQTLPVTVVRSFTTISNAAATSNCAAVRCERVAMQLAAAAAVGGCRGLHGCRGPELWRLRRSLVRLPSCGGLSAGESGSEQAPGQQTPPVPWRSAARAMHSYHQLTQRCIHKKSFHSSCSRLFARSSQAPATNTVTNTATNTVTNTMTVTGADTAVIGVSGSQEVVQKAPRKKKQPQAVLTQERSANGDNRGAVGVTATAKKPPKKVQPAVRSIGAAKPTTEAKAKASGSEKVVAKKAEQSSKTAEQEKQKQATLSVREIAATVSAAPYTSGTESSSVRIANAKFVAVSLRKQRPSTLSYEEAEEEVRRLDEELRGHDYQYYVLDSPSLSDQKYDRLVRRAMELIKLHPGLGASFTKLSYVGAGGLSADLIDTTDAKNSSPKAGKNKKKARKKAVEAFLPYLHAQPMLSLDNAFTSEELQAFTNRCVQGLVSKPSANITASETSSAEDSVQYLMEPKIDGLSLSLIYQLEQKDSSKSSRTKKGVKGRSLVWSLKLAGTRGDGQIGEEVTANVLHFLPSLPKQIHLPAAAVEKASKSMPLEDLVVDVRGEAYLSRPNFAAINLEREKRGLTTFTTARNGAAGILRRRYYDSGSTNSNGTDANKQDMEYVLTGGEEKYERRLSFFAYGLNYRIAKSATVAKAKGEPLDEILPESQAEVLEDLQQMGFDVARLRLPDSDKNNDKALSLFSREQLWDECVRLVDVRTELPYDTDGVVIKVNSRKQQEALGVATRFPRWAIAVKLDSQSAVTVLKDIVVQVFTEYAPFVFVILLFCNCY